MPHTVPISWLFSFAAFMIVVVVMPIIWMWVNHVNKSFSMNRQEHSRLDKMLAGLKGRLEHIIRYHGGIPAYHDETEEPDLYSGRQPMAGKEERISRRSDIASFARRR